MNEDHKDYVIFYFLINELEIDPRKYFQREVIKATASWSAAVFLQQPVCLVVHLFTKFKRRIVPLLKGLYRTRIIENNVVLFTPITLFSYSFWIKYKIIGIIDSYIFKIQFERFVKKRFPDHRIILWICRNNLYPLLRILNYNFLIYDYGDHFDYSANGQWSVIDAHYNELTIKASDLIVCTAKTLYQRANSLSNNAVHICNGVNFDIFNSRGKNDKAPMLGQISSQIIGWLGNIRNWMDFRLLERLITTLNEVTFVFIGFLNRESKKSFSNLLKYKNVKWIPYMEHGEAAAYVRRFDVGIIPFDIRNKLMDAVFPNKIFEYMAAGVPTVTTALPELKEYSGIIGYAKNDDEFIECCKDALMGKYDQFRNDYLRLAKENDW